MRRRHGSSLGVDVALVRKPRAERAVVVRREERALVELRKARVVVPRRGRVEVIAVDVFEASPRTIVMAVLDHPLPQGVPYPSSGHEWAEGVVWLNNTLLPNCVNISATSCRLPLRYMVSLVPR